MDGDILLFHFHCNEHSHHVLELEVIAKEVERGRHHHKRYPGQRLLVQLGVARARCVGHEKLRRLYGDALKSDISEVSLLQCVEQGVDDGALL